MKLLITIGELTFQVESLEGIHLHIWIKLNLFIKYQYFRCLIIRSLNCNLSELKQETIMLPFRFDRPWLENLFYK